MSSRPWATRARAADRTWAARHARSTGDRVFLAYAVLMVLLVTVVPAARAVWLGATSSEGIALLTSPGAPGAVTLLTAALWSGALLLGRERGPALLPPFPAYALGSSDLPRGAFLRVPLLRAGGLVTALTTLAAALAAGSLASHGLTDAAGFGAFTLAGALTGVIASVAWLAGQSLPRAAAPLAIGVLALGMPAAAMPAAAPFTPWGWVGLAYPLHGSLHAVAAHAVTAPAVAALGALAAATIALVPVLLGRLEVGELIAQAVRWESASTFAVTMDLGAVAATYRGRARLGRRLRAVPRAHRLWMIFLIRGATGAVRTPGRLVAGILALAAAGVLLTAAFLPAAPGWLLGTLAGVLVFAGLGPLTDGVRHAASVASDLPLYGIPDGALMAGHALFPLGVALIVLLAAVVACAIALGVAALAPLAGGLALGLLALAARVGSALKGQLPTILLAPIPTPAGDLSAAVRLAWAMDAVVLAALAGSAAVLVFESPVVLAGVAVALLGTTAVRWGRRRG